MTRSSADRHKPRVLLCGPPLDALGGGPTHMRNLLASPLRERFELLHFTTGSRGRESPARDESMPAKLARLVSSPFVLLGSILRHWPKVVHINSVLDPKAFWRDLLYLLVCRLTFRRVVLQFHGGALASIDTGPLKHWLLRRFLTWPDAVVMLARCEQQELADFGVHERVTVIPNGIDLREFAAGATRLHSGRVQRLGFMARLLRTKGIFEAMEAVRILVAEPGQESLRLMIAGSGPDRAAIEQWIVERDLGRHIELVGPVHDVAKVSFLAGIDVFLLPSYAEGLPYALLEALAMAAPVVASRVGAIPDVVEGHGLGRLVAPGSAGEIVTALRELAKSPENLAQVSRQCRRRAVEEYGLERLAERFGALYTQLLTGAQVGAGDAGG